MKLKIKVLSMILVISLLLNGHYLELNAASVKHNFEENTAVVETIDIPEDVEWEDLKLYQNVYDDIVIEKPIYGPEPAPVIEVKEEPKPINLGTFRITYYCGCYSCSEGWGNMTSTGVRAKEGRTIAVDPSVIPYGTHVSINGHEYIAEDCGGAIKGNDIDIYLEDHSRVYKAGVDWYDVYILRD